MLWIDGGGITIKGDTDKNITYALSRAAFTVNQNWEPISGGSGTSNYNLGSSSAPWGRIFIQDNASIADLDVTGIATFRGTVDVDGTLVDIAQDLIVGRNFRVANGITTLVDCLVILTQQFLELVTQEQMVKLDSPRHLVWHFNITLCSYCRWYRNSRFPRLD